jgi:hypothetical protein
MASMEALEEDETDTREDAIVSITAPFRGPPLALGAVLPGVAPNTTVTTLPVTPPPIRYLVGRDLAAGPVTNNSAWPNQVMGTVESGAPAIVTDLQNAVAAAQMPGTLAPSTAGFDSALRLFPGPISTASTSPATATHSYSTSRLRWFRSGTAHATPAVLASARQRGARLYCAARETARHTPTTLIGSMSLASFTMLGRRIDVFVIEPSVRLGAPRRFAAAAADGAQAFVIPLATGARVTPIRGIGLPSLPEVISPVALVAGDTEVLNREPTAIPAGDWQTVSHGEALTSSSQTLGATFTAPLFTFMGLLTANITFEFTLRNGQVTLRNGRLLQGQPPLWPPVRAGTLTEPPVTSNGAFKYYRGPWTLGAFGSGALDGSRTVFNDGTSYEGTLSHAMFIRAQQDDDVSLRKSVIISATAGIGATGGVSLPIGASLTARVTGSLTGTAAVEHDVHRDLELRHSRVNTGVEFPPFIFVNEPEEVLRVSPRASADLTLRLSGSLELRIPIPLPFVDDIVFTLRPFGDGISQPIANQLADWTGNRSLQIGSSSDRSADQMNQPNVRSTWPGRASFLSFPVPVPTCLADTSTVPSFAPACSQLAASGTPPNVPLCVQRPPLPPAIVAAPTCGDALIAFVNGDSTAQGTRFLTDTADWLAFQAALTDCINLIGVENTRTVVTRRIGYCEPNGAFNATLIQSFGAGSGSIGAPASCN